MGLADDMKTLVLTGEGPTIDESEFGPSINWPKPSFEEDGGARPFADERVDNLDAQIQAMKAKDEWPKPVLLPGDQILFGKPTTAYTSGATITLDPCDVHGTDSGEANVTAQAGWTLPTVTGTALTIPVTAIIPYMLAADGLYYAIGQPFQDYGAVTYSTSTHKLYQTTWYEWGWFRTTISDPQDITTAVDCTA